MPARYKVEALREINPADPTGPPSYQVFLVIDMELRPNQPQGVTIVTFSSYMPTAEAQANALCERLNAGTDTGYCPTCGATMEINRQSFWYVLKRWLRGDMRIAAVTRQTTRPENDHRYNSELPLSDIK